MAGRETGGAQVWGAAVVVASALAVVAAYLINGAALVLAVAGVETLLLMVYVARRWRALHRPVRPSGHGEHRRSAPGAAHCERCARAREALDARQVRRAPGRPPGRPPGGIAERAADRSVDRPAARHGLSGSAGRAVRHQ
ncbi:hypothetical protein ACIGZJ_06740 [Kitasatospora sp. NPDC052868]|uniref:hypothetical protein n=1 Tax=Kitasatospora sp. NPDC052868 TaxID=3364060 RepID=UPI0037C8812C